MGSSSDWDTLQHAVQILAQFGVPHEARVVSAHRMPDDMFAYAEGAQARGLRAIIAGAGGAAHLPGMLAAKTVVPVLGVPVASRHLQGVDSLYSIVACRWPPLPWAGRAGPTRRCSRWPCWPRTTPRCASGCTPSAPNKPPPPAPWRCRRWADHENGH